MIGLDTNVLVRYLAQDDAKQAAAATRLIEKDLSVGTPGFVSLVVLVELCWVLKRIYAATPEEIGATVDGLLALPQIHVERRDVVQKTLRAAGGTKPAKGGFVDRLIAEISRSEGCSRIMTFDKLAVRDAGMTLLS